jgi:hypothetical protein
LTVEGRLANHFEVAFTEYEFLIDFGQVFGDPDKALIHTRIIMNPLSAKVLLQMMREMVDRFDNPERRPEERKQ